MVDRLIGWSIRWRFLVVLLAVALIVFRMPPLMVAVKVPIGTEIERGAEERFGGRSGSVWFRCARAHGRNDRRDRQQACQTCYRREPSCH